jgi:DNA repair exonuclease SbcCD ATPase subunit
VSDATSAVKDATSAREAATGRLRDVEAAHAEATKDGQAAQASAQRRGSLVERVAEERERLQTLLAPFDGEEPDVDALRASAARRRDLEGKVTTLASDRRHLDQVRTDLGREVAELARCRTRLEAIDREAAELAFDAEAHASLRKERDEAQRLLDRARTEDRQARDAMAAAERELGTKEGMFEQARESAAQAERLREDARYLGRTTTLLDGFRDHLVGRIGPELSREAEALFRELTGAEYDDLKIDDQTLAIHIADGTDYFPIERFSGSETDLANLALRVAISKRLSYMSGTDIGMLVLDEVLASLDAERKDLFVRAMGRLSNHFHQLFVITHAEQVKDQFQAVIEVQKTARRRSQAVLA